MDAIWPAPGRWLGGAGRMMMTAMAGRGRRQFGPGGFGPGRFGRGFNGLPALRRARRGDVRTAVLALLNEEPMHGYRIIQEITERTNGLWRPSPGSVYPTIAQLEDEGLVAFSEGEAPRTARLTVTGRAYAGEHLSELEAVWTSMTQTTPDAIIALRDQIDQTRFTLFQLMQSGSEDQLARAERVFAEACRSLGDILAEDTPDEDG